MTARWPREDLESSQRAKLVAFRTSNLQDLRQLDRLARVVCHAPEFFDGFDQPLLLGGR